MGQYHLLINVDKKEFVHGHRIDNGLKLMEQCGFEKSTSTALWLLLACSNGRGGGDAKRHPLIGRWAGDRIAVIGDYHEPTDIPGLDVGVVRSSCYPQRDDHGNEIGPVLFADISAGVKQMLDAEFGEDS